MLHLLGLSTHLKTLFVDRKNFTHLLQYTYRILFFWAFAKFGKATINFVRSVCPSVCPYGTIRLPLDGFLRNFMFESFSKSCRENSSFIKSEKNNRYFTWGRGPRWRSWLRHCATSQKVTGSIPDGVIGIFHWHNPSGRTMALGLTQPLTEMSTGNISWG